MSCLERRYLPATTEPISIASRAGRPVIAGFAAVHYDGTSRTQYAISPDVFERVRPTAFVRAIAEKHDVRGLFNHDANHLLGRLSSGTLRLKVEPKGLKYEIDFDAGDADHARVMAKIQRGDLTGSSFAFRATRVSWEKADGHDVRWIEDVDLYDVGPVTFPAYDGATTGVRSDEALEAIEDDRQAWLSLEKRRAQLARFRELVGTEGEALADRWATLDKQKAQELAKRVDWADYQRQPGDDSATLRRKLQMLKLL